MALPVIIIDLDNKGELIFGATDNDKFNNAEPCAAERSDDGQR